MERSMFAIALTSVLLNAFAQLALKKGVTRLGGVDVATVGSFRDAVALAFRTSFEPFILGGLLMYVVSVGCWLVVLSRSDVSAAYPLLAIGFIFTTVWAWLFFGEAITLNRGAGIASIIIGVLLITRT